MVLPFNRSMSHDGIELIALGSPALVWHVALSKALRIPSWFNLLFSGRLLTREKPAGWLVLMGRDGEGRGLLSVDLML